MAKSKKAQDQDEEALIEQMNEGLRRMLKTPPETHAAMVLRRRKTKRQQKATKK